MEIRTTARHFELTDNLRKFAAPDGGTYRESLRDEIDVQGEGL
jgi:hypothetical protein